MLWVRSPTASFLMIRDIRKCTRTRRVLGTRLHQVAPYFCPFPISPTSYIVFVSRQKTDARVDRFPRQQHRQDCAPELRRTSHPPLSLPPRIRCAISASSTLPSSAHRAYNMGRLTIERRRREVSAAADVSRAESGGRAHRWHLKYARETTAGRISLILRDDITFSELFQYSSPSLSVFIPLEKEKKEKGSNILSSSSTRCNETSCRIVT